MSFTQKPILDFVNIWYSNGDGTFDVRSFSPWPGYVMDTGSWLVGDFNGDGRSDLMHVLPGTNGVNVWLSDGRGKFKVMPILPRPGYVIPNGPWLVGDFNDDGHDDVVHVVESEGRVGIWLSNRDGTFRVETFAPWPNYAIPNGQWLTGDFNGDGSVDLLHAVEGTSYANVWLSNLPGPLSALVLVCSLSNTPALADCNRSNAVSVLDLREPFDSPIMCMMHGQASRKLPFRFRPKRACPLCAQPGHTGTLVGFPKADKASRRRVRLGWVETGPSLGAANCLFARSGETHHIMPSRLS